MPRTQTSGLEPSALYAIAEEVTACLPNWVVIRTVNDSRYGTWTWNNGDRSVQLSTWPAAARANFTLSYLHGGGEQAYLTLTSLAQVRPWLAVLGL